MWFMRDVQIITGALSGRHPPERPVPAPRGTKGMPRRSSAASTPLTCAVVRGSTSRSGALLPIVHPSHSYTASSLECETIPSAPTIFAEFVENVGVDGEFSCA